MDRLSLHLLVYKLAALAVGGLSLFLGYQLFGMGISAQAHLASLTASHGQSAFELQNAAPGIFFALFGAAVIGTVVFRGMTLRAEAKNGPSPGAYQLLPCELDSVKDRERLFVGVDLKRLLDHRLNEVWQRLQQVSLADDDRRFLQLSLLEISSNLDRASKGWPTMWPQIGTTDDVEEDPAPSTVKFEGFGSHGG